MQIQNWASTREVDLRVARAIHQVARETRLPHQIWEAPTAVELKLIVALVVAELVGPDDYAIWGQSRITANGVLE